MESQFFASFRSLLIGISAIIVTFSPVTVNLTQSKTGSSSNQDTQLQSNVSRNWAGYAATGGTFSQVSGTWVIPTVSPSDQDSADAAWVGIGGVDTHDLIQSGTQAEVGQDGQIFYNAWVETLPRSQRMLPIDVNPGDSVTVSISQKSPNNWSVSFINNTSGEKYQNTMFYESSMSSAEWIEEAPSSTRGFVPLDNFGSVKFDNAFATKDSNKVSPFEASAKPIYMAGHNQILASVSSLGSDGNDFTVTRTNESASDIEPAPQFIRVELSPRTGYFRLHFRRGSD